jgi:large subunit ribosomal protein L19e
MDISNQKRMASDLLACGKHRVFMDPNRLEDISEAVTRGDIRRLIASGAISAKQKKGQSRGRALFRAAQKKKGRRRGSAHRKGAGNARFPKKARWMARIRPIRAHLSELRDGGTIDRSVYRVLYRQAKGGIFHNRSHLDTQLRLRGLVKGELKPSRRAEERRKRRRDAARSIIPASRLAKVEPRKKKGRKAARKAVAPAPNAERNTEKEEA